MQVTAESYARLTELLARISWSWRAIRLRALPYVNAGIILALAGLDYSGVIEPELRTATPNRPVREEVVRDVAYCNRLEQSAKNRTWTRSLGKKTIFSGNATSTTIPTISPNTRRKRSKGVQPAAATGEFTPRRNTPAAGYARERASRSAQSCSRGTPAAVAAKRRKKPVSK